MKKTNYKLTQIAFITCLLVVASQSEAQLDDKTIDPGYNQTQSTCASAVYTYIPTTAGPDANGVTATDKTDVRAWAGSCNQQTEVFIAIDKHDPRHLIAGANTLYQNSGGYTDEQGYYYSPTYGTSWNGTDAFPNITPVTTGDATVEGDPTMAFDLNGNAFMVTLDPLYQGFYITSSNDATWNFNGLPTWSGIIATPASSGLDKEMMAIDDAVNSPYLNNIYVAATQFTQASCVSANGVGPAGGIVFYYNTTANATTAAFNGSTTPDLRYGAGGFGQGANVQTGPNGEVYVCWADYALSNAPNFPATNIGFAYSADGGATFPQATTNSAGANNAIFTTGSAGQYSGGVDYYCGGADPTYGPNPNPPGNGGSAGVHVTDFPAMAVDKGCGAYSGRIYITYPEADPGGLGFAVIALCYSDNHGLTWSQPTHTPIISNDPQFNYVTHSFLPWIAVDDATGIVSVVYYQLDNSMPNDPNAPFATNTYVAYSSDGGNTFTNIKVSDVPHINETTPGYTSGAGYIGNYIGIAAHNGKAYAAWMDNRIQFGANSTPASLWQLYISEIDYTSSSPNGLQTSTPLINLLNVLGGLNISGTAVYDAAQEVVIPYSGTFISNSGSNVNIFACNEVDLTDGFSAANELHAYIDCIPTCVCTSNCVDDEERLSANNNTGKGSTSAGAPKATVVNSKLGSNIKLGIFPNPTSGVVYLNLSAENAGSLLVNISDVNGKQLLHNSFDANVGANSFKVDLGSLNQGVYFINVTDENGVTIKNDKLMLMPN